MPLTSFSVPDSVLCSFGERLTASCRAGTGLTSFLFFSSSPFVRPAEYFCQKCSPVRLQLSKEEAPRVVCHHTPDECLSLSTP